MCAVATNLIRVTRPAVEEADQLTVLGYYFDASAGVNGRIYAYEYNVSGQLVNDSPFILDLPTTGDFTDFVWSVSSLAAWSGPMYDGSPGLTIVDYSRGGCWFWRPRTGTLADRVYYPVLTNEDTAPIYIAGSFYVVRQISGGAELHRLDSSLDTVEVLASHTGDSVGSQTPVVASDSFFCKRLHLSSTTWVLYPISGAATSTVELGSIGTSLGAPYSAAQTIIPGGSRFPRLLNVSSAAISHLWPNESPWIPQNTAGRVQFVDPYILGFESLSGSANRVVLGAQDAAVEDEPIADFLVPSQGGIQAFIAGIGNLP